MQLHKIEVQPNGEVWFFMEDDSNSPRFSFEYDAPVSTLLDEMADQIVMFNQAFRSPGD